MIFVVLHYPDGKSRTFVSRTVLPAVGSGIQFDPDPALYRVIDVIHRGDAVHVYLCRVADPAEVCHGGGGE